jgi:hypothetical protein
MLFGTTLLLDPTGLLGGLAAEPDRVHWLFAPPAARCVGYGIGMFAAAHAPERHRLWIDTMIGIQIVDFVATAGYLAAGALPAGSAWAVIPPLLWVFLLCWVRWQLRTIPLYRKESDHDHCESTDPNRRPPAASARRL